MGTKVHSKGYVPGYHSMRDPNEDSSSSSWSLFNGDKSIRNGPYHNGFMPKNIIDGYPEYDKDALKQKMLEHEAIFKNQVYELHRLYRIQRDMMEEVKRTELHRRTSLEPSSSSTFHGSQVPSEDAWKWHMAGFPLPNSGYCTSSISPMSCAKGYNTETGRSPFQNGLTSKDTDAFDSRPLKVRKKLFDLRLPADEYVDTEEVQNGNQESDHESTMNLLIGDLTGVKTDWRLDASASASSLKNSVVLADLNEPFQIEEATVPSSVGFFGHTSMNGEIKGINLPAKSNASHLGIAGETTYIHDRFLKRSSIGSEVNESGHLNHIYKAGPSKSNLSAVCQGFQQDKLPAPSHSVQGMLNIARQPNGMYPNGCSRDEWWKEGTQKGLEFTDRNRENSNNSHFGPVVASKAPDSYPFFSSSSFASSWAHSVSSWAKPTSSFTQKITFESSLNPAAGLDKNLQPAGQSQETLGGKWPVNGSSGSNQCFGSEVTAQNGFYHGSGSGSKKLHIHLPPAGFDLNYNTGDSVASDRSTNHGFGNYMKGSGGLDSKPAMDINLNEALPKSSPDEAKVQHDRNVTDGKSKAEDHLSALPWLKHKPDQGKEARRSKLLEELSCLQASSNRLYTNSLTISDLNQPFTPKVTLLSSDCENARKQEIVKTQNVKTILGVPIFDAGVLDNKLLSHASTLASVDCPPAGKNIISEKRKRVIDINLEWEPDEQIPAEELTVEKEKQTSSIRIRDEIDLNSCISDWEDPSALSYESKSAIVKRTLEIDLEAPVSLEIEDDYIPSKDSMSDKVVLQPIENKPEQIPDDVVKNAAEAIVSISSSCPKIQTKDSISHPSEISLAESLLQFADAVSSHANELENATGNESLAKNGSPKQDLSEEIDEFEVMTLQLEETKEEDYMPAPFVPEVQKVEDTGANTTRPRRGQGRRGRPRKDFQRDILPGLTSLSRHEVTEDLQTFGGMMRATGHSWNTGSTRRNGARNGGGRGRRRAAAVEPVPTPVPTPVCSSAPLMQQLNIIEAGLEDSSSLTGWGKTTRRPRRQRGPAGNPPIVVLT